MDPASIAVDEEAVSPVLGVILMVAITVVLAATVFFVVSGVGEKTESAPQVGFIKDSSDRTITVLRVSPPGTEWLRELHIAGTCAATATLNGVAWPPASGTPVLAGDVLGGCASGDTLQVIATKPNQLLFETTFL